LGALLSAWASGVLGCGELELVSQRTPSRVCPLPSWEELQLRVERLNDFDHRRVAFGHDVAQLPVTKDGVSGRD
jgi:hypothetical protein